MSNDNSVPTPPSSPTQSRSSDESLGMSLQDKGKQFSIESVKTLDHLDGLKVSYESMQEEAELIQKTTDLNDYQSVSKSKGKLAQLLGNIEKLQFNKLDAITTTHLDSGKAAAKTNRRELNASLEDLQDFVLSLYAQYDSIPTPPPSSPTSSMSTMTSADMCSINRSDSENDDSDDEKDIEHNPNPSPNENLENVQSVSNDHTNDITEEGQNDTELREVENSSREEDNKEKEKDVECVDIFSKKGEEEQVGADIKFDIPDENGGEKQCSLKEVEPEQVQSDNDPATSSENIHVKVDTQRSEKGDRVKKVKVQVFGSSVQRSEDVNEEKSNMGEAKTEQTVNMSNPDTVKVPSAQDCGTEKSDERREDNSFVSKGKESVEPQQDSNTSAVCGSQNECCSSFYLPTSSTVYLTPEQFLRHYVTNQARTEKKSPQQSEENKRAGFVQAQQKSWMQAAKARAQAQAIAEERARQQIRARQYQEELLRRSYAQELRRQQYIYEKRQQQLHEERQRRAYQQWLRTQQLRDDRIRRQRLQAEQYFVVPQYYLVRRPGRRTFDNNIVEAMLCM